MSDIDNEIKTRLNSLFPNPEIASRVTDLVVPNKRPKGWSKHSNAPYYKAIYAKQIKHEIDRMVENNQDMITYRYSVWCNDDTGMSPNTLYSRINLSIRYLIDYLDTDNKYALWYETVRIEKKIGIGVVIQTIPGLKGAKEDGFSAEFVEGKENLPVWRQAMDTYLESNSTVPFIKDGLILTPSEIVSMKNELCQLSNITFSVTSSCIKIIKTR